MKKINRSEFISHVAWELQNAGQNIPAWQMHVIFVRIFEVMKRAFLSGNYHSIEVMGFGTFVLRKRADQMGRIPNKPGSERFVKGHTVIAFVPSEGFKKRLKAVPAEKVAARSRSQLYKGRDCC